MPRITLNQKYLRKVRSLGFCYLCGKIIDGTGETDKDHVPPENIFARVDRNPPLKLQSHKSCNNRQSDHDQLIGQLVSLLRGKTPPSNQILLDISHATLGNKHGSGILHGTVLEPIVRRWIRGFHAALYESYLAPNITYATVLPFPKGKMIKGQPAIFPIPEMAYSFTHSVLMGLQENIFDSIVTCNGKMQYVCTWMLADNNQWICIYALDLYGWSNLGDIHNFDKRGCTGMYQLESGDHPAKASTLAIPKATVEFSIVPDVFHYVTDYKQLGNG